MPTVANNRLNADHGFHQYPRGVVATFLRFHEIAYISERESIPMMFLCPWHMRTLDKDVEHVYDDARAIWAARSAEFHAGRGPSPGDPPPFPQDHLLYKKSAKSQRTGNGLRIGGALAEVRAFIASIEAASAEVRREDGIAEPMEG